MTDREAVELLPCPSPWCPARTPPLPVFSSRNETWHVACACGVRSPSRLTEGYAIEGWNTRIASTVADSGLADELVRAVYPEGDGADANAVAEFVWINFSRILSALRANPIGQSEGVAGKPAAQPSASRTEPVPVSGKAGIANARQGYDCAMCDGTGYKDYAGFAMDPCDHVPPSGCPYCYDGNRWTGTPCEEHRIKLNLTLSDEAKAKIGEIEENMRMAPQRMQEAYLHAQVGTHPKGEDATHASGDSLSDAVREANAPNPSQSKHPTASPGVVDYRGIALAAIQRARQAGESQEMLARWISEDIHSALATLTPSIERDLIEEAAKVAESRLELAFDGEDLTGFRPANAKCRQIAAAIRALKVKPTTTDGEA